MITGLKIAQKPQKKDWDKTIKLFLSDREKLKKLAQDPKIDIYQAFPWGDGQSVAREISVVTDHNAYHLGEFAIMRQVLGAWGKSHK